MAYSNFDLNRVSDAFSLDLTERDDLFALVPEIAVNPSLRATLDEHVPLAIDVNTEKMRSELIIAPILVELRRLTGRRISLFSGIDFNVSDAVGLNGVCDFIVSLSQFQLVLRAPAVMIVEAKREDINAGLGQCAAEMMAARIFNERKGDGPATIHGAVTTGTTWRFLKLEGNDLMVDRREYTLEPVGKILAILLHCVGADPARAGAAA